MKTQQQFALSPPSPPEHTNVTALREILRKYVSLSSPRFAPQTLSSPLQSSLFEALAPG